MGKLDSLPSTGEAFRRGDLSSDQVRAVTEAATVDPSSERELLDDAGRLSLHELKDKARRVRHAADGVDEEARYRRIHRERYLRTWTDDDGAGCGSWRTTPDDQALILEALGRTERQVFDEARRHGSRERPEAYVIDALTRLATTDGSTGTPGGVDGRGPTRRPGSDAKIIVRVDHAALRRGAVAPGEVCEIAGIGPIPVSVVRSWIANDAFLAAIVTDGVDIRNVVHLGRKATALQRSALEWLAPVCCVEGCSTSVRLEIDHRDDWAATRSTTLDALDRLCAHHHALKTRHGYQLAPGTGKRPMLPPGDPGLGAPARAGASPGARQAGVSPGQPNLLDTG